MSGLAPFHIQNSRILIRRFLLGEIDDFLSIRNDPYTSQYHAWLPPLSPNDGWTFMTRQAVVTPGAAGVEAHLAIIDQHTSALVGSCFIKVDASGQEAEVGLSIHSRWSGRGYEQEVLVALVAWVKEGPRVRSVTAKLDTRDGKSLSAYTGSGFAVASQNVWAGRFPYYFLRC